MGQKGGGECKEIWQGNVQAYLQGARGCWQKSFLHVGGGKRYYGDKDAVSLKCWGGDKEFWVECDSWGLLVLVGGDSRRYCGERAGATVICLAREKEAQAFNMRLPWEHFVRREE